MSSTRDNRLAHLYEVNEPWVYALIARIVPDPSRAEELVRDVFWRAWRNIRLPTISERSAAVWLRLLARNVGIESLQPGGLTVRRPRNFDTAYLQPYAEAELSKVASAVATLTPHEREVFELTYFEGLSHVQIAEITGRSLGTVKTWARSSRLRVARRSQSNRILKGEQLGKESNT